LIMHMYMIEDECGLRSADRKAQEEDERSMLILSCIDTLVVYIVVWIDLLTL